MATIHYVHSEPVNPGVVNPAIDTNCPLCLRSVNCQIIIMSHTLDTFLWLRVPDLYLPSQNIKHTIESDPDFISDPAKLETISDMIGVAPTDTIMQYVTRQKKRLQRKLEEKRN